MEPNERGWDPKKLKTTTQSPFRAFTHFERLPAQEVRTQRNPRATFTMQDSGQANLGSTKAADIGWSPNGIHKSQQKNGASVEELEGDPHEQRGRGGEKQYLGGGSSRGEVKGSWSTAASER